MWKGIKEIIGRFAKTNGWEKRRRLSDRRALGAALKQIRGEEFTRPRLRLAGTTFVEDDE